MVQKVFLRFKEVKYLQKYIRDKFQVPELPFIREDGNWLQNYQKKVENRKMQIEKFILHVLKNEKIAIDSAKVLELIGLPTNFYRLPEMKNNQT